MNLYRRVMSLFIVSLGFIGTVNAGPETYKFDVEGAHAFIQFKIPHLGYSMLLGEFTEFDGTFVVDPESPENSMVEVTINPKSIHSNHGERDKHLRGDDLLDVESFPTATFKSTQVELTGEKTAKVHGELTLKGITKPIVLEMSHIGAGADPWGGYRRGFEGTTSLTLSDFGIDYDLGPSSKVVEIYVSIEGIRE